MPERSEPGAAPRALLVVSSLVLVVAVPAIFLGAWRMGVTWDEPFHVQRLRHYLDTGWFLGDGQVINGRPSPEMTQQYVYAPVTMLLLHGLCMLLGVEGVGEVSLAADAYAVRHLGIGLIGCLGILSVALTARVLFRRWSWSVVAGALLVAMPLWTGYAMFNVKDVPVATGYALATLGLVLMTRPAGSIWARGSGPVALAGGITLCVGTRPGMWVGLAVSCFVLLVCQALRNDPIGLGGRARVVAKTAMELLGAVVVAGLVLWQCYPRVFGSPLDAMRRSLSATTGFREDPAPLLFTPIHMLIQLPLVVLGLIVVGSVAVTLTTIRSRFRLTPVNAGMLLVCCQAFAMPVGAMLTQASLYGDLRQELFAVPSAALIATYAVVVLCRRALERTDRLVLTGVVAVGMLTPVVTQMMVFPYNYSWHNPLSVIGDVPVRGDYQRGSGREIADLVPPGRVVCSPVTDETGRATRAALIDGWQDCGRSVSSPISTYVGEQRPGASPLDPDEFWAVQFEGKVMPNCDPIAQVSRSTPWQRTGMARLSRCRYPFPVLGPEEVVDDTGKTGPFRLLDTGWFYPATDNTAVGYLAREDGATMTFQLRKALAGGVVTLRVGTVGASNAVASFGGVPVAASAQDTEGFTLTLSADLADRAVDRPLTLAFRAPPGQALRLKLVSLQVRSG